MTTTDCISLKAKLYRWRNPHGPYPPRCCWMTHITLFPITYPQGVSIAMGTQSHIDQLMHYVIIEPALLDGTFVLHCKHTVIALGLCMPIILGLPFLTSNNIVCDYADHICTAMESNPPYDLLAKSHKTKEPVIVNTEHTRHSSSIKRMMHYNLVIWRTACRTQGGTPVKLFTNFRTPSPHSHWWAANGPCCQNQVERPKPHNKVTEIVLPTKMEEAWHTLLQQHLAAGCIHPSSAPAGSSAFIIQSWPHCSTSLGKQLLTTKCKHSNG